MRRFLRRKKPLSVSTDDGENVDTAAPTGPAQGAYLGADLPQTASPTGWFDAQQALVATVDRKPIVISQGVKQLGDSIIESIGSHIDAEMGECREVYLEIVQKGPAQVFEQFGCVLQEASFASVPITIDLALNGEMIKMTTPFAVGSLRAEGVVTLGEAATGTSRVQCLVFGVHHEDAPDEDGSPLRRVVIIDAWSLGGTTVRRRAGRKVNKMSLPGKRRLISFGTKERFVLGVNHTNVMLGFNIAECVVCLDRPRAVKFSSCEHLCVCAQCGEDLRMCPLCRVEGTPVPITRGDDITQTFAPSAIQRQELHEALAAHAAES